MLMADRAHAYLPSALSLDLLAQDPLEAAADLIEFNFKSAGDTQQGAEARVNVPRRKQKDEAASRRSVDKRPRRTV